MELRPTAVEGCHELRLDQILYLLDRGDLAAWPARQGVGDRPGQRGRGGAEQHRRVPVAVGAVDEGAGQVGVRGQPRHGEQLIGPDQVLVQPEGMPVTAMNWLIDSSAIYELMTRVRDETNGLPLYITENGRAAEDYVNPDGEVNDVERVRYLRAHLEAAARAIQDGASLAGYFVWSLLDNFEWGWGYQKRFGLAFVDFGTQKRIIKRSGEFYAAVTRANAVPLE